MNFIIDYIHYLINESKMLIFVYNSNRKVYVITFIYFIFSNYYWYMYQCYATRLAS